MSRVLVALSGGVDSSVAAALLLEQGHDAVGCIGVMHEGMLNGPDVQAAQDVARHLGIPFHVVDLRKPFEQHVISPFCSHYLNGLTPSPCIECNRFVKFGALLEFMRTTDCQSIATGHYARIEHRDGGFELHKPADSRKDQSYMLARLTQDQLAHAIFPLGGLTKDEVRARAQELGFSNAARPESQDICFIPDGAYVPFIEQRCQRAGAEKRFAPGCFIDAEGAILGQHNGIIHYTIGQRKGIGLAFGEPRYVCAIDARANTVTIGTADDLLAHDVTVRDFSWISGNAPSSAFRCTAKIRYHQSEQAVAVRLPNVDDPSCVLLRFDKAQRAVTPGQYAVLYSGTRILGAGRIDSPAPATRV